MSDDKDNIKIEISNNFIKSVAKAFLPEILEYYNSDKDKRNDNLIDNKEKSEDKPSA